MKHSGVTGTHAPDTEPSPPKQERRLWDRIDKKFRLPIVMTVTAAATIILLALAMLGTVDAREYRGYMSEAEQHIQAGDYDSALSYLRKAAAINGSSECALLMADCYEQQENYEKALSALNLAQEPNDAVRSRMKEIERLRARALAAEKLNIAGKLVDYEAQTLVLDGVSLEKGLPEELSQLRALNSFSAVGAGLSDISALANYKGIVTLNLSGNNIKDISPLAEMSGLRKLYLDDNPIRDFSPLLSLTNLSSLSIRGMEIDEQLLKELSAALPDCAIYSDRASIDAVEISLGGVRFRSDVKELDLSGTGIREISALSQCGNLRRLNLSGNRITDISPLVNLPSLEWLDVSYNEIADLNPLISISTLRTLYAGGNRISGTAAVGAMSALTELDLSDNPVEDFSGLKKLRDLKTLLMRNSGVNDEALSYLEYIPTLTRLELDGNPEISSAAIESFQRSVPHCLVVVSNLVVTVEIGGQSLRSDTRELDISFTGTSDLSPLASMDCLKKAKLSGNGISNIYIFMYSDSRFTLQELDLSANSLEDITPLSMLLVLETLDLSGNNISTVNALMGMDSLKKLNLKGNPLTEEQVDALRVALPNCEINF